MEDPVTGYRHLNDGVFCLLSVVRETTDGSMKLFRLSKCMFFSYEDGETSSNETFENHERSLQ